jgi:tRNA dimethylallyltransferase
MPITEDILARGKTPIICGGTGQYIDALIYDTQIPAVGPNKKLREELEALPTEELTLKLQTSDPQRFESIDIHNRVRLIRALEIVSVIGKVPPQDIPTLRYDTTFYLMNPTRELIRERIAKRLLTRVDEGMLDEGKKLLAEGVSHERLEKLGLEYRYMARYLRGDISYDEFITELTTKICQYAKRQQTWNKKYLPFAKLIDVE